MIGDEGLVDLQRVGRQALEVAERGVSGPEVVEGDTNADRPDLVEPAYHRVHVVEQQRLGDLQHEQLRGEPGALELLADDREEGLITEL